MRIDILPLCDKHYRTMAAAIAPFSADYSIEFFRCTAEFCQRCFSERLGYVTPRRNEPPLIRADQPRCDRIGRPWSSGALDGKGTGFGTACPGGNGGGLGGENLKVGGNSRHNQCLVVGWDGLSGSATACGIE